MGEIVARIKLKNILRPVREALYKRGANITYTNESIGSSFVKVSFHTLTQPNAMVMKIDCRDLQGHEKNLQRQIFNLMLFHDANWLYYNKDELLIMEALFAAPSFTIIYPGDLDENIYGLESVHAVTFTEVDGGWSVSLTQRGAVSMEMLLDIKL